MEALRQWLSMPCLASVCSQLFVHFGQTTCTCLTVNLPNAMFITVTEAFVHSIRFLAGIFPFVLGQCFYFQFGFGANQAKLIIIEWR